MVSFSSLIINPSDGYFDRQIEEAVENYLPKIPEYQYHNMVIGFLLYPCIEVYLSPNSGTINYSGHEEDCLDMVSYNPDCFNEDGEQTDFYMGEEENKKLSVFLQYTLPRTEIVEAVKHFSIHQTLPEKILFFDPENGVAVRSRNLSKYIHKMNMG